MGKAFPGRPARLCVAWLLRQAHRQVFHIILIALFGLLAYSNTFNAPFQWDENGFITKNPIVKNLHYFLEPSDAKDLPQYSTLKSRYVGYLTFALNYKLHGFEVTGYHIVNTTIHILNALLVYLLIMLTFRTPFMARSSLKEHFKYMALLSALLFVSHPVQTEAVTYIFQRLASLMSFFYLSSLAAYIASRLSKRNSRRYALYALSLVTAVLAMKTKENAFTLPLVVMLYELFFFRGLKRHRMLYLIPFFLTAFIVPLTLMGIDKPAGEIIRQIGPATRGYGEISRGDYLLTQFRVVVTYIRLLFFPVNQNLDYDYPVYHSFSEPPVLLSFLFLLAVFSLGIYLLLRSRANEALLRMAAFGLFWFFITLSVESSIIPIDMLIDEYRVYLPSVGAFLAITTGLFILFERLKHKKIKSITASSLIIIPLLFSYATYARNSVWGSEISLWEDVVSKSPGKERGHYNLGLAYYGKGSVDKAIEHYQIALKLKPDYVEAHNNLGNAYESKGLTDKAIEHYLTALRLKPDHENAHYNLGNAYKSKGLTDKAIEHYLITLRLNPDYEDAHINLGIVYRSKGLIDKAIEHYLIALRLKPDYPDTHNNLGNAYFNKGWIDKAIEHYLIALRLNPDYEDAHYNLGGAYLEKRMIEMARREFEMALQINPGFHKARQYLNRINKIHSQ